MEMTDYPKLVEEIKAHLMAGGMVQITTYTRSTVYDKRHAEMFKVGSKGSPLVKQGKGYVDFRWASVRFNKLH